MILIKINTQLHAIIALLSDGDKLAVYRDTFTASYLSIGTLIIIAPPCRLNKIYLPDCNALVVIGVFNHAQELWIDR